MAQFDYVRQWILGVFWITLVSATAQLEIMNQWSFLKYNAPFSYPLLRNYVPENAVFTGMEVGWDRVFLATPRLWPGNPATVSWIPRNSFENSGEMSPALQAYPNWDWHRAATTNTVANTKENCTNIISVFRIRLDKCDRLWILDSGVMDSLASFNIICPPKLLIFDSRNDQLIRIVTFPPEILRRNSLLTNLVIDDNTRSEFGIPDCDNVFVYMTDSTNPALVVYDSRKDSAWRITNPFMYPDPNFGTYRVAGESFTLMDGIIGIALSAPILPHKQLYFQPFASDRIFTVPTSVLKAGPNSGDDGDLPVSLVGHKSSQGAPLAVEPRDGALIFSPISETAIATWIPGSADHGVLAYDPELLQFPLDIRVSERDNGNIWIITTKFQKFFRKTVNGQEFNLRILRIKRPVEPLYGHNNSSIYFNKKKKK
ncbi:hypothetical protein PGB90_007035 [Kerria lacca]